MSGRRARDRVGVWIAGLATVVGLWMGLVAPSVSPVTPAPAGTSLVTPPGEAP
jgi:hypothetical protein